MKPVKLYMKNIGPYRDETIDFTKLDNMFLIKGDTGAGKTFIFDSITYALYGQLRGNRKGHESDFKSRYAPESEESFVEFTFEIAGKLYRINRTVPFYYTNRNGNRAKKNQDVSLEEQTGGSFTATGGKLSEINEKIHRIIGLSADEFAQIVVLPQGEFAEFLHQNTKERMNTLEKLFPVAFYADITRRIKEKADAENLKLRDYNGLIESISKGNDFTDAEEKIGAMQDEIAGFNTKEAAFIEKRTEYAAKLEGLKHEKSAAEEYEKNCAALKTLQAQEKEFESLGRIIMLADKAKGLREFISSLEIAQKNLHQTQEKLGAAEAQKDTLAADFSALDARKAEMQALKEKIEKDGQQLKLLQEKLKSAAELDTLHKDHALAEQKRSAAEARKNQLEAAKHELERGLGDTGCVETLNLIAGELQRLTEKKNQLEKEAAECRNRDDLSRKKADARQALQEAQNKLGAEEEKLARTKATLAELETKQKEDAERHQAFTVSQFLKAGCPCPVCGSIEHPSPAQKPEGLLDYDEQIKTLLGNIESLQQLFEQHKGTCAALTAKLEEYESGLAQISASRALEQVQDECAEVEKACAAQEAERQKISRIGSELAAAEKALDAAKNDYDRENLACTTTAARIQAIEKSLGEPLETLRERENALRVSAEADRKTFAQWEEDYNSVTRELAAAESAVLNYRKDVAAYQNQALQADKELANKIACSEFASVEAAKAAYLDDAELEQKRRAQNTYNEALKSARDAVDAGAKKNLKASADVETELQAVNKARQENESGYAENHRLLTEKQRFCTEYQSDFEKIRDAQEKKLALEAVLKPLNALNDNLSGKNPQKLQLESWALGMYFEQVVDFASTRFNDISDGRFFFKLKQPEDAASGNGFRGLDLMVLDTHTGKTSDAAELSGGETFEASISLALAITDVVQNNNGGGIQLDSLFIDEGFGTLDPETLEKAMAVLTELGQTKMIGMISHVTEMEDFPGINSSITVHKSTTGSTVSVK